MADSTGQNGEMWVPEEFICRAISDPTLTETRATKGTNGASPPASNECVFPDAYYRLFDRKGFAFPVEYKGREIRCIISCKALVDRFGAQGDDLKTAEVAFMANRQRIEQLVGSLIHEGKVADDNEIVIK